MTECWKCGYPVPDERVFCPYCLANVNGGQAPAAHGLSDGPGSRVASREMVFERQDTEKEMALTFSKMEEAGEFKGRPEKARQAKALLQGTKDYMQKHPNERVIDYQKTGLPDGAG